MLEDLQLIPRKFPCKIRTIAESLSDSDAKILIDLVEGKEWPISTLEKALNSRGLQVSAEPLIRHRNKTCSCNR